MKVLIVEDEQKLALLIKKGLLGAGFVVEHTASGTKALELARHDTYDAIVLDIMIPDRDGLSVLRLLRKEGIRTPIIIITARDAHEEIVEGLDAGADDYMVKPFFVDVLIARLQAVWRRTMGRGLEILSVSDLRVNLMNREVTRGEEEINLPVREFNLLIFLMRNPGRVFSRVQIFEHVWEYNFDPDTNLVDVYIGRLRRKIDDAHPIKLIETVRGIGYRIRKAADV